jgi:hypothetical protein
MMTHPWLPVQLLHCQMMNVNYFHHHRRLHYLHAMLMMMMMQRTLRTMTPTLMRFIMHRPQLLVKLVKLGCIKHMMRAASQS